MGVAVEDRNDAQTNGIVGNRELQQKRNRRMTLAEDSASDEPGQGNIGCGGHAPAPSQCTPIGDASLIDTHFETQPKTRKESSNGTEDAAKRRQQGAVPMQR